MEQKLSEKDILKFIVAIGDDSNLLQKILERCFSGYAHKDLSSLVTKMDNPDEGESLLVLRHAPFLSFCEHHVSPISGTISIGYIPDKTITSLGSLARLVNASTQRLQIQERICSHIATAIEESLSTRGVIVHASAKHSCTGEEVQSFDSISKRGVFLTNKKGEVQEFFSIIK